LTYRKVSLLISSLQEYHLGGTH